MNKERLTDLAKLIRYYILHMTAAAGSGHPTSALSAVELMAALFFDDVFRYNPAVPDHPNNDRLIFSKGHASPLLYALWLAAGQLSEQEIMGYRSFGSELEGHPTKRFRFTEAATGSLGQGLSIGVGFALNAKYLDKLPYRTYVLIGDSEMAEGSQWEAMSLADHYKLDNLIGILDVNRLGQTGETMYGWNLEAYRKRIQSFGWETIVIDGHDFFEIHEAYRAVAEFTQPVMIIARTVKGKGVSFVEDRNGWHGKPLEGDDLRRALEELGKVNTSMRGSILPPEDIRPAPAKVLPIKPAQYEKAENVATREAYGRALKRIAGAYPELVSLDGEVSNSTRSEEFKASNPNRYFEMYIAEQNMVGVALGLSLRRKTAFVSTFAAFLTRAFDQIRMSPYSRANIKFVGSHAGVSIGQDGPSQMGLEDIAMFRTLQDSVVLYPCDAVSTEKLVEQAARHSGNVYLRTTRMKMPIIYDNDEEFVIGGCKLLRQNQHDAATVVAAGVTVHEAIAAHLELQQEGIQIRVIDLYSIKPLDVETLRAAVRETAAIITVEDHGLAGGIGEAVASALSDRNAIIHMLAVKKPPMSGQPRELLDYEEISRKAIVEKVKSLNGGWRS